MKISLGKKGDYSVRAVLDLAVHYRKGRRKAQEIAKAMKIPETYLPRILSELVRAGLVQATAGRDGGYELASPPSEIRMLEVVEATDGGMFLGECVLRGIPCAKGKKCAVHDVISEAQGAMRQRLQRATFAEIAKKAASS